MLLSDMRYLKYLFILMLSVFVACEKEEEHIVILELDHSEGTIPSEGGSLEVCIKANYSWWLEGESDWCSPSANKGKASETGEIVTFTADTAHMSRSAKFSFHCGLKKVWITISQDKQDILSAKGPVIFNVPSEGCLMKIPVDSNCDYDILVSDDGAGWTSLADDDSDDGFCLYFAANTGDRRRSSEVVVRSCTDPDVSLTYTISQPLREYSISYTTKSEEPIMLYHTGRLGSDVISHTVAYGFGVIECEAPIIQIGDEAFKYAHNMTSITIPPAVNSIGVNAFIDCKDLKVIHGYEGVRSLEIGAFQNCAALESFHIPEGVVTVSAELFSGCGNLVDVVVPETVTAVETSAFKYCSSLVSLDLPEGVTSLGKNAFSSCSSLEYIRLPYGIKELPATLFEDCSALKSVELPLGVTIIGPWAFGDCISLENINVPETVVEIEYCAFNGCSALKHIVLPENLKTIGNEIFRNCHSLEDIVIPENVDLDFDTNFGLFWDCFSLKKAVLPSKWNSIPQWTFANCRSLQSYSINENVRFIGSAAFAGCHGLKEICLPSRLTSIAREAFALCINLEKIIIPEGVTSIEMDAFSGCQALPEIHLPSSLQSIYKWAFTDCPSLKNIYLSSAVPPTLEDNECFDPDIMDRRFYVPQSSVEAYKAQWGLYSDQITGF